MGCPPLHRVDHVPKLILTTDDAWDHARIQRESDIIQGKTPAADDDPPLSFTIHDGHPWARFVLGLTRGDLEPVRGYLLPSSTPWVFTFRRLKLAHWALYKDREKAAPFDASLFALRYGLQSVEGTKYEPQRGGTENGPLDQSDLDRLRELVGDQGIVELATMAVSCSRELLEDEKKP